MNIKDPQVRELAHELAALRGSSATAAVRAALEEAPVARMSAASVLELSIVTTASGPAIVDEFLDIFDVQVLKVDADHLSWARRGHARYGRGSGPQAKLNFGDCFAYAAAKACEEVLLFKGRASFIPTSFGSDLAVRLRAGFLDLHRSHPLHSSCIPGEAEERCADPTQSSRTYAARSR